MKQQYSNKWAGRCSVIISALLLIMLSGCSVESGDTEPLSIVTDFPIAYIKRPLPANWPTDVDVRDLTEHTPGGDLYLRDRASPTSTERNITEVFTAGLGDVRGVEVSYDGSRFIFAMRAGDIEGLDDDEQPTWNIWEYEVASSQLRRIISSDIIASGGQDIAPHYLPDGRIIFSSTRQRQGGATLLDEGKPKFIALEEDRNTPAFVLHSMNSDGNEITQLSFNPSHDLDPSVLSSGEVIFSRWDNMGSRSAISLYKMLPDGSEMQLLYGAHSHDTGTNNTTIQYLQSRELPDGRLISTIMPFSGTDGSGEFPAIDTQNFIDINHTTNTTLSNLGGTTQNPVIESDIRSDGTIAPGGLLRSIFPLWDGSQNLLISWSPCRLLEAATIVSCTPDRLNMPGALAAPPLFGIYIYNTGAKTMLPLVTATEGTIIEEVVASQSRTAPPALFDNLRTTPLNTSYSNEEVGVLHIRSVYDIDGTDSSGITTLADPQITLADDRPARFLRIVKAVPVPDRDTLDFDNIAYGRSTQQLMREIIGYAPIEPDGSVMVKVPANVALTISVLGKNGRRLSVRHENWIQVMPGETKECNGCHNHASAIPHGRVDGPPSANTGAVTSGLPFPNTEPAMVANMGETMAETRIRLSCLTDCAALLPSVDLVYDDLWTDPLVRPKDSSFAYRYSDLTTPIPTTAACQTSWNNLCRTIINYEQHIHPLWNKPRLIMAVDRTCTLCHNNQDAMAVALEPAAQLDLSDGPSDAANHSDHFKTYHELFFNDDEQEVIDGLLVDRLEPQLVQDVDAEGNPLFETDIDGNLILDGFGQPIPVMIIIMVTIPAVGPSMSTAAANSGYFLTKFDTDGSHEGWLDDAEKRLISEWLDIGAQYYNNPFDAP